MNTVNSLTHFMSAYTGRVQNNRASRRRVALYRSQVRRLVRLFPSPTPDQSEALRIIERAPSTVTFGEWAWALAALRPVAKDRLSRRGRRMLQTA